ncbi:MAG TPA: CapA family protein, partial [Gaiellaceae bacterium]|nr:CapA family protein [Gaiellaceae bacterium]
GTARTRREARRILLLDAGGVTVAFLAATYGTNGIPLPRPWSVDLIRPKRILADARKARRQGADLVVASLHCGPEYGHRPTSGQRALARRLLRPGGVDLLVGQHAHVVQTIGRVRGRFVVYGEGNLLSAQSTACCPGPTQDGLVAVTRVRVEGERVSVRRADYVPIYVRRPDFVVVQVGLRLRRLRAAGVPAARRHWPCARPVSARSPWSAGTASRDRSRAAVGTASRSQYQRPRANPPKAIRPIRAMIRPIQKLQTNMRTIPTITSNPPSEIPPTILLPSVCSRTALPAAAPSTRRSVRA